MVNFDVEGAQNVEVSKKFKCEKPLEEQLEIMESYTRTHQKFANASKHRREVECLKVIYPKMFRSIENSDLIAGRLDFLPIGFGSVTSVGGVGHYCVFAKLREFEREIGDAYHERIEKLYNYWLEHDLKTIYCKKTLTDTTIGRFIDVNYPMIATARLSGMMLDYEKLLDNGISGIRDMILNKMKTDPDNEFYRAILDCLDIFAASADHLRNMALEQLEALPQSESKRKTELSRMADALLHIREDKPSSFHEALQLVWLFALLAGVINYGRLDDFLGVYLSNDLENGKITEDEAYEYIRSLWTMIENRRTTVNGRIIVGGKGRKNPREADIFMRIALRVCRDCRYVEPQFTLRIDESTSEDTWDAALDAIGDGATYPTLYNDEVNVPAVSYGMRVDIKDAERYVPFGCTEFVIWGKSTGTPNVCINLLKLLTVYMNIGIDPIDGKYKLGIIKPRDMGKIGSFEEFYDGYKELVDYYMDLCADAQYSSYEIMNEQVGFLFTSILMDDCIERGRALLDGGVKYLGGTCETYGNINTSDSLYAIKKLVFEDKAFTLTELCKALKANFVSYEHMRKMCVDADKYGNDLETADSMANDLYEYVAKGIRSRGIDKKMQYFLIVISNNSLNTEWGIKTGASPDGRTSGMYMNPANNPQGGADKKGPTAMLNSLCRFDAKYHAGSVQNIKFTSRMLKNNRDVIKTLFKTYFKNGGCHLMVTVIDRGALEDAVKHPEKYPNLIVRVAGYSAVFVDLHPTVKQEIMSRTLYGD